MCSVGTNSLLEGTEDEARRDDGVEEGFTLGVGTREKIKYRFCMKSTMGDSGVESPYLLFTSLPLVSGPSLSFASVIFTPNLVPTPSSFVFVKFKCLVVM